MSAEIVSPHDPWDKGPNDAASVKARLYLRDRANGLPAGEYFPPEEVLQAMRDYNAGKDW